MLRIVKTPGEWLSGRLLYPLVSGTHRVFTSKVNWYPVRQGEGGVKYRMATVKVKHWELKDFNGQK